MDFTAYQTAVLDDLSVSSSDTFHTTAAIKRAINRAIKWAAGKYNWVEIEQAYKWTTTADDIGKEYINYPETFKTDTIKRLEIGTTKYVKTNFNDYLEYQENNGANATDKLFSDHRRQYFMNPAISAAGLVVSIWGSEIPADLVAASDQDPFYNQSDVQEAILKKALSILYKKQRGTMYDRGIELDGEASNELSAAWSQQKKLQADYQPKDSRIFNSIPGGILRTTRGRTTRRGSFRTCP